MIGVDSAPGLSCRAPILQRSGACVRAFSHLTPMCKVLEQRHIIGDGLAEQVLA